ncbi:hypothetical protein [uncultured Sphingomonas sp.]|uniref:hypothetical protein n=1 Tax=uncultured Sphingomonas sp. TaxID=158754 RepID=UPI0025FD4E36|nr:hypothetical protein [uncultured Sphingomonas sp.]
MNDNYSVCTEAAFDQARTAVDMHVLRHRAAAIPTLIAACVDWSVRNGMGHLVETSLRNAVEMVPAAVAAFRKEEVQ